MLSEKKLKKFNEHMLIMNTVVLAMVVYFLIMLFLPLSVYDNRMNNIMIIHKSSLYEDSDNQKVKIINTLISNSYEEMSTFAPIKIITKRNNILEKDLKAAKNIRSMKSINKSIKDPELRMLVSKTIVDVEKIYLQSSSIDLIKRLFAAPMGALLILILRRMIEKDLEYQLENDKEISFITPSP